MKNDNPAVQGTKDNEEEARSVQACKSRALKYLSTQDQRTFLKKFREQEGDDFQVMHTFRELLAGVFMAKQGFTPQYEPCIGKQTPDWLFHRSEGETFFADVVNFHSDNKTEGEQMRALKGEGIRMWAGWMSPHVDRLYHSIKGKAAKYKDVAIANRMPFVVIIYGLFWAALMPDEVEACLLPSDGLFTEYPNLSGVYHMREVGNCWTDPAAGYRFDYYANPNAACLASWLSEGVLPYLFPAARIGDGE